MHRFVREKGIEGGVEKHIKQRISVENGQVARQTYESVLQMPSTSNRRSRPLLPETRGKNQKSHKKCEIPFDKNQLFRSATSNDVVTIERMKLNNRSINVTDQFGWTALIMAAYEGHLDTVKLMIRLGAKIDIENSQKDTALTLAAKRKHEQVVDFLKQTLAPSETICLSSDDESASADREASAQRTFFCESCQSHFLQPNRKSHEASTVHRFNRTDSQTAARHFGIPESNVGFRMLLRQGWNRESGLGAERDGIMYPIKTTLRKSRSGLGTKQPAKPKVTHFKAFDCSAVKSTRPPAILNVNTRKYLRSEKLRNQRKDRYLRKLLS